MPRPLLFQRVGAIDLDNFARRRKSGTGPTAANAVAKLSLIICCYYRCSAAVISLLSRCYFPLLFRANPSNFNRLSSFGES
jgi:hypothetical protein